MKILYGFTEEEVALLERIVGHWKRDTIRFDSVHGGVLDMSEIAIAESIERTLKHG